MSKTDETFQEAILALREWLGFMERKERDFQEQMERARRKAPDSAPPAEVAPPETAEFSFDDDEPVAEEGKPDGWL